MNANLAVPILVLVPFLEPVPKLELVPFLVLVVFLVLVGSSSSMTATRMVCDTSHLFSNFQALPPPEFKPQILKLLQLVDYWGTGLQDRQTNYQVPDISKLYIRLTVN